MSRSPALDLGHRVAALLYESGAVHVSRPQPFILAAGWASPVYVDCRVLMGKVAIRRQIIALAAEFCAAAFPANAFDAVAGGETAGIPFAALLAEQLGFDLRYVRKHPLGVGRNSQVEGGAVDGLRVLLIDDLTTDGASKLDFVRGLRAAGATVEHALTIFFHNAFAVTLERLEAAQFKLHALATWREALPAMPRDYLADEDRRAVEEFLANPVAWSTRNGGRGA
jgi:orotate phosphoribosyltransferase